MLDGEVVGVFVGVNEGFSDVEGSIVGRFVGVRVTVGAGVGSGRTIILMATETSVTFNPNSLICEAIVSLFLLT